MRAVPVLSHKEQVACEECSVIKISECKGKDSWQCEISRVYSFLASVVGFGFGKEVETLLCFVLGIFFQPRMTREKRSHGIILANYSLHLRVYK